MDSNVAAQDKTTLIARLNDQLRCHGRGGKFMITRGIDGLPVDIQAAIIDAVRSFDHFTPDNDPHGERDCGGLTIRGHRIFWKVDYYDANCEFGPENLVNPDVTRRVLTIMLSHER